LVKAIAILSRDRSSMLPELASAQEQGLNFEASTWFGFFLPRGTPEPIIQTEILQMNPKPASMFAFSRPSCKTDARC